MLKTTPFHERTSALCVSHAWRRWAGYLAASSYELTHEREYHVIRTAAALLKKNPRPTDNDIDAAMTNICRCGTYQRIREAVHMAASGETTGRRS